MATADRAAILAELTQASIDMGLYDVPSPCCPEVASAADVDEAARRILAGEALPPSERWYRRDEASGCGSRIAHESGVGWPHRSAGGVEWSDGDDRLVDTGDAFRAGRGV